MNANRGLPLGRLLRLSLFPTVLADIVVGVVVGAGGHWPAGRGPWLLIASSLSIYHGAMVLNDWADRRQDAFSRPERPIPAGRISPAAALGLALGLTALGIGAATLAAPRLGIWMAALAALATAYDLAGRGRFLGPVLLGCCRAGNLGAGLLAAAFLNGTEPPAELALLALCYGGYVWAASSLARLEDDEDRAPLGTRPTRHLRQAAVMAVVTPLAGALVLGAGWGLPAALLVVVPSSLDLWRRSNRREPWTRAAVGSATGTALRRLVLLPASLALLLVDRGPAAPVAAAIALAGLPLGWALRRWFPPT